MAKERITRDEYAELSKLCAEAAGAQKVIERCVDEAEKILDVPASMKRSSDIADSFYSDCNLKWALRQMGVAVDK